MPDQLHLPTPLASAGRQGGLNRSPATGTEAGPGLGPRQATPSGIQQWLPELVDGPRYQEEYVHLSGSYVQVLATHNLSEVGGFRIAQGRPVAA